MKQIAISTIDELYKSQVKGYTRTRKGKMERVSPYSKQFALKEKRVNRAIAKLDKVEKIKTIGSQRRESLATTDFELVGKKGKEIILRDKETGIHELWARSDDFAGYTIDVGGKGYEFLREVKDVTKLESMGVKIEKPGDKTHVGGFQHKHVDLRNEAGIKLAEQLKDKGWKVISHGLDSIMFEKPKKPLGEPFSAGKDKGNITKVGDGWKVEHPSLYEPHFVKDEKTANDILDSLNRPKLGEPFSATTKQMEHEVHRMSTMSDKALMTRANKITDIDKLIRFYAVADTLQKPDLKDHIRVIGMNKFGLSDSDFEPFSAWEKKGKKGESSKKTGTTKGLLGTSVSQEDIPKERKTLFKGEVKPFTRTRRGKFEQVKGFHRDVPFTNKEIRGQVKEGRIVDVAFKPSDTEKWKKEGKVLPIRGNKLIEDIKAGTSPYQKMSLAENYIIDVGGYGPRGEPYSTKGTQIQKLGGVDVKNIIKATHPTYKGRKVSVSTSIPSQLNSWWDEGYRTYYTFYELATGRTQGTGSNHPMFEASKPRYLSSLPRGVVIVARNYMGAKQSITIYANANDLEATSHPTGVLDEAKKNFTGSPNPIPQSIKPEQFLGSPFSTKESYRIGARVSGGITGTRESFVKDKEGKVKEFSTKEEAEAEAKRYRDTIGGGATSFHYWVETTPPPSTPEEHQIKIAKDTLKMPQAMAGVMGGPTKEEARKILKEKGPWYGRGMGQPTTPELREKVDEIVNRGIGTFSTKERTGPRAVYQIAQEIAKDWGKVNYAAKPYLDAMHALETIDTPYGADSGASVIAYFLANANTWKGEKARQIKKELNAMLKTYYKKSMEDDVVDRLMKAESRVKSHSRIVNGKLVNVREHQRYKLRRMINFIKDHKKDGATRGTTLRKLQDRFGLSTEMAHRVHRLAEGLGSLLFKPLPAK